MGYNPSYTGIAEKDRSIPRNTPRSGWKPVTLHPAALLSVTVFTAALVAVLGYLSSLDAAQDGLAFALTESDFSTFTTFSYLYLPTIISVVFSMLWAWIDLDMKRLEPFFQMSWSGGASAANSILLQYPFDFIALAPIQAARRRHWGVFVGGLVTVLIFWAITPLNGAIFDVRTISKTTEVKFNQTASPASIRNSGASVDLDVTFLEQAWNIIWHNTSLPAFSTRSGAIIPIKTDGLDAESNAAKVNINSTMLTTTIDCQAATVNGTLGWDEYTISNGKGCEFGLSTSLESGGAGRQLLYFNYADDPRMYYALSDYCSYESVLTSFVSIVASPDLPKQQYSQPLMNLSAQFCVPLYWQQPVQATIQLPDLSVTNFTLIGDPISLTSDMINTTAFETILGTGYAFGQNMSSMVELSAPEATPIAEWLALNEFDLIPDLNNMRGFIIDMLNSTSSHFEEFYDSTHAAKLTEQAHQLLFSVAAAKMLSQSPEPVPREIPGTITRDMFVVRIIHPFDYVMQSLLAVIASASTFLAVFYRRRPSKLVADVCTLHSFGTIQTNVPSSQVETLMEKHAAALFELRYQTGTSTIHVTVPFKADRPTCAVTASSRTATEELDSAWPFYLSPLVGAAFAAILIGIIAALVVLQEQSAASNGLNIPWQSSAVQQIVLNYLPTLVATFLEPFWTLLNRMLCILQPFEALRTRTGAKGSVSIDVRYSSLPPQLALIKALRNRHFRLAGICLVGLSANILAVSMNALFQQSNTTFLRTTSVGYSRQTTLENVTLLGNVSGIPGGEKNTQFQDHFYLANMNLTESAVLPVWTADDHFILPLGFNDDGPNESSTFVVTSRGLAVSSDCHEVRTPSPDGNFQIWLGVTNSTFENLLYTLFNVSVVIEDGTDRLNCSMSHETHLSTNGTTAFEMATSMGGADTRCGQYMFVMYARNLHLGSFATSNQIDSADSPPVLWTDYSTVQGSSQTFLLCHSAVSASTYTSRITRAGQILSSEKLSRPAAPVENAVPSIFSSQADADALAVRIVYLNTAMPAATEMELRTKHAHTSITSPQWFTYLMAKTSQSSKTIDPARPAPSAAELIPLVQAVNAKLGALILYLQMDLLFPGAGETAVERQASVEEIPTGSSEVVVPRLFFNTTMFGISLGLLGMNLVACIVFYVRPPRKLESRKIPTTIYDQMGLFRGSSVGRNRNSGSSGTLYRYGRYLGLDGTSHVGVERAVFVRNQTEM